MGLDPLNITFPSAPKVVEWYCSSCLRIQRTLGQSAEAPLTYAPWGPLAVTSHQGEDSCLRSASCSVYTDE